MSIDVEDIIRKANKEIIHFRGYPQVRLVEGLLKALDQCQVKIKRLQEELDHECDDVPDTPYDSLWESCKH